MPENIEKKESLPEEEGQVVEIEEEKNDEPEQKPEVSTDTEITTEEPKQEASEGDDLSEYSEAVKKRIAKLTKRFRDEEKQRAAAVEFAESVKKQNEELKAKLDKLDTTYVGEFDTRVQSQAVAC